MDLTERYMPRSGDVVTEEFDGEFVVLDLASGKYFGLSGSSALVWKGLVAGHSPAALCAELPADDPRRDTIAGLTASLVEHGLLVTTAAAEPDSPAIAAELAQATGPFGIEMFDDLADLILTDPIHEVDQQAGWPVRPADEPRD